MVGTVLAALGLLIDVPLINFSVELGGMSGGVATVSLHRGLTMIAATSLAGSRFLIGASPPECAGHES
ncbi:hypothetical protein [Salinibacter altiplanensis]|uniref:hypothetical protein n=1 Tax=Salinibacter altiplanensis TaxID=1803181 RepID=UPI000C9F3FD3|nr:hypothetical protein [Salinibacter altiplanensis]